MGSIIQGKYSHTYTVTASDITPLYRLTPNAMLMYLQDSFARLMTTRNVAAFDIVKQRRMWVVTEVQMNVEPTVVFWSEDITVEIWVSELTSLRIYCDFRIVRRDNGQLIASGISQWNILNLDTKRLETTDFLAESLTVVPELITGKLIRRCDSPNRSRATCRWNIVQPVSTLILITMSAIAAMSA